MDVGSTICIVIKLDLPSGPASIHVILDVGPIDYALRVLKEVTLNQPSALIYILASLCVYHLMS